MILNPNDPTGLGLFSKCARSQASKVKSHRPATPNKLAKDKHSEDHFKKKSTTFFGFEKQQSRDQRQRKYRPTEAPPVGQYNPITKRNTKLVWNVLKIFNNTVEQSRVKSIQNQVVANKIQNLPSLNVEVEDIETPNLVTNTNFQSINRLQSTLMSAAHKSQCVVNMSRMTGRRQKTIQANDWGDSNVIKSVNYVKGSITKNISFDKQPRQKRRRYKINPATNYQFDYKVVKPKRNGLLDFSSVKAREEKVQPKCQYSYQHYEYDSYVWSSNSKIYPNTKIGLIQFGKQTNRYKKQSSSRMQLQ